MARTIPFHIETTSVCRNCTGTGVPKNAPAGLTVEQCRCNICEGSGLVDIVKDIIVKVTPHQVKTINK